MLDSDPSRRSIHISASDDTAKHLVSLMIDGAPQEFADFGQIKDVLKVCQEYNLDFIARSILPHLRPFSWPFCKEVYAFAAYYDDSDLASNAVYHFHQFFRDESFDKLQLRLKGFFSSEPMLSCKHKYLVALLSVVARIPSGWYTSSERVKEFGMDFRVWQVEIKHFKP